MGVGDGQGGLVCCDSWGRKELDMIEQLNWTELYLSLKDRYKIYQYESEGRFLCSMWQKRSNQKISYMTLKINMVGIQECIVEIEKDCFEDLSKERFLWNL